MLEIQTTELRSDERDKKTCEAKKRRGDDAARIDAIDASVASSSGARNWVHKLKGGTCALTALPHLDTNRTFDLIIGSDLLYDSTHCAPLAACLARRLEKTQKARAHVVLAVRRGALIARLCVCARNRWGLRFEVRALDVFEEEREYYSLIFRFTDSIQLQRMDYEPHFETPVLNEIRAQERKWGLSGKVTLMLLRRFACTDKRVSMTSMGSSRFGSARSTMSRFTPIRGNSRSYWDCVALELPAFMNLGGVMVDPHLENVPPCFSSWLNNSILSSAVKTGVMQMYEHLTDRWVEVLLALNDERIHIISTTNSKLAASVVALPDKVRVELCPDNAYVFQVYPEDVNECKLVSGTAYAEYTFKVAHKHAALEWVYSIQNRAEIVSNEDMIASLEMDIEEHEFDTFLKDDLQTVSDNIHFEGMVSNHTLRPLFEKYLADSNKDENFKFWQYAEDFRRGHPQAESPFAFRSSAQDTKLSNERQVVRHWAGLLFGAFLEDNSPYQVGECSSEERIAIKEQVLQNPAPDIFGEVQTACFRLLKFAEYPDFVTHKSYVKHLRMSYLPYARRAVRYRRPEGDEREGAWTKASAIRKATLSTDESKMHLPSMPCPWRKGQAKMPGASSSGKSGRGGNMEVAFQPWLDQNWWNYIDMTEWKSFATNSAHEDSLGKMLPKWMPLNMDELRSILSVLHDERKEKLSANYKLNDMNLRRHDKIPKVSDPPVVLAPLDGKPSMAPRFSDHSALMPLSFGLSTEKVVHEEVHPTRLSVDMRDPSVPDDSIIGDSIRRFDKSYPQRLTRRRVMDPIVGNAWGIQGTFIFCGTMRSVTKKREQITEVSKLISRRPSIFGGLEDKRITEDDLLEHSICDESTKVNGDVARRIVVLTNYHGQGRLYIIDPRNPGKMPGGCFMIYLPRTHGPRFSPEGNMCCFHLPMVNKAGDRERTTILFEPEGITNYDSLRLNMEWIRHLHPYCGRDGAVGILKYGPLEKEGMGNKQLRLRTFVLTTDGTMHYYKPDNTSHQGFIDLRGLKALQWIRDAEQKATFFKNAMKRDLTKFQLTDRNGRAWVLASRHKEDAVLWGNKIYLVAFGEDTEGERRRSLVHDSFVTEMDSIPEIVVDGDTGVAVKADENKRSSTVIA